MDDAERLEAVAEWLDASRQADETERAALRAKIISKVWELSESTVMASQVLARWAWRRDQDPLDHADAADDFRALAVWLRRPRQ